MLSPEKTAERLTKAIEDKTSQKPFYRFQMSVKGISSLAERPCIDAVFLANLSSEMFSLGWCMFPISHTSYCFIKAEKAEGWRKISGERLLNSVKNNN